MTFAEVFRFPREKERLYERFQLRQEIITFRIAGYLVLVVVAFLTVVDYFRVEERVNVLLLRSVILGVVMMFIYFSYSKTLSPVKFQGLVVLAQAIFVAALFSMEWIVDMPSYFLFNAMVTILYFVNTISGMRYRHSLVFSVVLMGVLLTYMNFSRHVGFYHTQVPNIIINFVIALLIGYLWEWRKRLNFLQHEALNEQTHALTRSTRQRDRLISILSHDIVSPLAALEGMLNLRETKNITDEEWNTHLPKIKKSIGDNVLLLQNLVRWSQTQLEEFKPDRVSFPLGSLVAEVLDMLAVAASKKDIQLVSTVGADEHVVLADKEMTRLALRNIIINAIKFSNPGGKVSISSRNQDGSRYLSIDDEGVGMTEGELADLFTMKKSSQPGTANERGTGLGLFITKQFIDRNNGQLLVTSQKGKGTSFRIILPER